MMLANMSVPAATSRIERHGETARCVLSGEWTLRSERPDFNPAELGEPPRGVEFDAGGLGPWDSGLLVYLLAVADYCTEHEMSLDPAGLPENAQSLLALAIAVPEQEDARVQAHPTSVVEQVGQVTLDMIDDVKDMIAFAGECTLAAVSVLRGQAPMRWKNLFTIIEKCGPDALPIVALISGLVGVIIAFLGAMVLQRMAAEVYVSYIVGYGMLRELGALMVGMIMAGRTGAAFAAEIGSMKVSEEVDALKTLGVSPLEFLVLPRILALTLMMPILTSFADLLGIAGGYLISAGMLGIPGSQFFGGLRDVMSVPDVVVGLIKGGIFGMVIGFAGCLRGMRCGLSAAAVGEAATSAVVTSITLIVIANAVVDWLTIVYKW